MSSVFDGIVNRSEFSERFFKARNLVGLKTPVKDPPKTGVFMEQVGSLLKSKVLNRKSSNVNTNVDNVNKDILDNVNNVNDIPSNKDQALQIFLEECGDKPESLGQTLAEKLGDLGNLNFYIKAAKFNSTNLLFEALAITLDASKKGRIHTRRGGYYVGVLRKLGGRW